MDGWPSIEGRHQRHLTNPVNRMVQAAKGDLSFVAACADGTGGRMSCWVDFVEFHLADPIRLWRLQVPHRE